MITLQPVTRKNWRDCIDLSLATHQTGYVATNLATIAESKFESHYVLRAIYAGDTLVGMLAYCHEDDPEDLELYWIFRLMIDQQHQQQGHGTGAMKLAIEEIKHRGATRIRTMHKPENAPASAMYRKLGFHNIGFHDDGDVLLEMSVV